MRRVGDICDAPSAAGSSEGTGGMSGSEVSSSLGAQAKAVADEYIGAASSYLESLKLME